MHLSFPTHSWHTKTDAYQGVGLLEHPKISALSSGPSAFSPRPEQTSLQWATPTPRSLQAQRLNRSVAPSPRILMESSDYDGRISPFVQNFSDVVNVGRGNADVADTMYTSRSIVSHASADLIMTPRMQNPTHLLGVQREVVSAAHLPIFITGLPRGGQASMDAITVGLEPAVTVFRHSRIPSVAPSGGSCPPSPGPYHDTSPTTGPVIYNINKPPASATVRTPPRNSTPRLLSPSPRVGFVSYDQLGYA
jgi:hypothetical protein